MTSENNSQELTCGIAARLKELRENWTNENGERKELSHSDLAQELNARYGLAVHPDTLKFYEAGSVRSESGYNLESKLGNNLGMRLETLYALSDFYSVSTDYILGRDPYPLSDRAKTNISRLCDTPYRSILNDLLSSSQLLSLLQSWASTRITVKKRIQELMGSAHITEERIVEIKAEARHLRRDNAEDMEKVLHSIGNFRALDTAIKNRQEQNRSREEAQYGEHTED